MCKVDISTLWGAKHSQGFGAGIVEDSHKFVGSDHDMVVQQVVFNRAGGPCRSRPNTRPRRVTVEIPIPKVINQEVLENMNHTSPYKGVSYRDPPHVKTCFQHARHTRLSEDWKRALAARDKARKVWCDQRILAANSGDWQAYREHSRKGASGWEGHVANHVAEQELDPHSVVHNHFQKLYQGDPIPLSPSLMFHELLILRLKTSGNPMAKTRSRRNCCVPFVGTHKVKKSYLLGSTVFCMRKKNCPNVGTVQ